MRYKLTIEYDGTNYLGFQKQPQELGKTIEGELLRAVKNITGEDVEIAVSGRTDRGVHAIGQVIHFDLEKDFESRKLPLAINAHLEEEDIAVVACEEVNENFHARFSSKKRHYRYVVINRHAPLKIQKNRAWLVKGKIDIAEVEKAAKYLLGTHDFTSFRDSSCQAKDPVKNIEKLEIIENGEEIYFDISAQSFLQHMVRNIVGTLIWVGYGKIAADDIPKILEAKSRPASGPNAPSCGLFFLGVDY